VDRHLTEAGQDLPLTFVPWRATGHYRDPIGRKSGGVGQDAAGRASAY
jgi:hypothetical protein